MQMCFIYTHGKYIQLFNYQQFSIPLKCLPFFISDSILLLYTWLCYIMLIYFFTYYYMLSHTIIIYFLYTFAILHKLFSKTWYMHPWLYNSANYVPSAENAIPQTVKTPPWYFTAQFKCHWHLNICYLLTPQSIFCFSSCIGTIFWFTGMCTDIYFFLSTY